METDREKQDGNPSADEAARRMIGDMLEKFAAIAALGLVSYVVARLIAQLFI